MTIAAATGLLARMLFGISATARKVDSEAPDFGASIETDGNAVASIITLESGDTYRVTVEWLPESSP